MVTRLESPDEGTRNTGLRTLFIPADNTNTRTFYKNFQLRFTISDGIWRRLANKWMVINVHAGIWCRGDISSEGNFDDGLYGEYIAGLPATSRGLYVDSRTTEARQIRLATLGSGRAAVSVQTVRCHGSPGVTETRDGTSRTFQTYGCLTPFEGGFRDLG